MAKKLSVAVLLAALLALPIFSYAVMSGPDSNVNSNWRASGAYGTSTGSSIAGMPDSSLSVTQTTDANGNSSGRSDSLNSSIQSSLPAGITGFKASLDVTITVTGIDAANKRIALNGYWVDLSRVGSYVSSHYPSLSGLGARASMILAILKTGDQIRVKANANNGILKIQTVSFDRPGAQGIGEISIRNLLRQVGSLLSGTSLRIGAY